MTFCKFWHITDLNVDDWVYLLLRAEGAVIDLYWISASLILEPNHLLKNLA